MPVEVQLTNLVKLEDCGVSLAHSIHHTRRYLAASLFYVYWQNEGLRLSFGIIYEETGLSQQQQG